MSIVHCPLSRVWYTAAAGSILCYGIELLGRDIMFHSTHDRHWRAWRWRNSSRMRVSSHRNKRWQDAESSTISERRPQTWRNIWQTNTCETSSRTCPWPLSPGLVFCPIRFVFSEHQGCFCRQCTSDLQAVHTNWRLNGCDGVVIIHLIEPVMLNLVSGAVITGENSEAWTTYHRERRTYISVRLRTTHNQSARGTA